MGKGPEQRTYRQMVNRHMKRHSVSLIIRKMRTKTTLCYHLTPVRTAIGKSTSAGADAEKREPSALLVGMQMVQPPPSGKAAWSYLKKLKMELPYEKNKVK